MRLLARITKGRVLSNENLPQMEPVAVGMILGIYICYIRRYTKLTHCISTTECLLLGVKII